MENLSSALSSSITGDLLNTTSELTEIGLDSILDEGLIKDIPFVSSVIHTYKIGKTLRDRHYIKKLWIFIQELNRGVVDERMWLRIKTRISENQKEREKELEYLLLLIERYISDGKPAMLAKLYLAFLDQLLTWEEVTKYGEVIDRLLPGDYEAMQECFWYDMDDADVPDSLLRLIALGLVISHDKAKTADTTVGSIYIPPVTRKDYELTDFGAVFLRCMKGESEFWKKND